MQELIAKRLVGSGSRIQHYSRASSMSQRCTILYCRKGDFKLHDNTIGRLDYLAGSLDIIDAEEAI